MEKSKGIPEVRVIGKFVPKGTTRKNKNPNICSGGEKNVWRDF